VLSEIFGIQKSKHHFSFILLGFAIIVKKKKNLLHCQFNKDKAWVIE